MKKRNVIAPAIIGNIVEYYDFGLYAVYAPIIGHLFFPSHDLFLETLSAFTLFAVGFFMRPFGGIFFGYIGDKLGRKISLTISILGMALCTFLIGILPDYNTMGILGPIILIFIRLFQGLCVGGEGAGVAIFVLEHLEGYRPGLIGSIVMASNMVGTLLAVMVGIMMNHFCDTGDCWRYAFIMGGFMGLIGLYMRYQLNETPIFVERKRDKKIVKHPIVEALKYHWPRMLVVLSVGGATSAVAYTIRGYLNSFFVRSMGYTQDEALYFTLLALLIMIILLPFFGLISDKVGYRKFLYLVCYTVIFTIIPTYILISNEEHNILLVISGLIILGALSAAICAPAYPYSIKAFEAELRFSGVAFSWNLGNALLGGTTPAISTYLANRYGNVAPAYYLIMIAVSFIMISFLTRKHQH
jgi:MFS transporter, MHS family, proline/betaine transporter